MDDRDDQESKGMGTRTGTCPPDEEMIVPGNNRRMQRRRKPRRRLFGKRLKEGFLEHFSCTANIAASAAAVGISEGVVYTHRRKDAEFRDAFWMALEQGAAKLVALRVQRELERAASTSLGASTSAALGTGSAGGGLELRLDGPPDERQIADLIKLMATLRDLCRGLGGGPSTGSGQAGRAGRIPQRASVEETCRALARRLKAYDARVKAGTAAPPPRTDGDSLSDCPPTNESQSGDSQ